jgi:hypothetical protein
LGKGVQAEHLNGGEIHSGEHDLHASVNYCVCAHADVAVGANSVAACARHYP